MTSHTSNTHGISDATSPLGSPETDMQELREYDQQDDDSIEIWSDPEDDDPSDIESFGADDLFGSDPDAEIIWTRAQLERQPPSSDDQLVWPLPLCNHSTYSHNEPGY